MPWYQTPDVLSALGSLAAVLISLIALFLSQRGQSAQQLREKREELRGVLERLIILREEQNALNKEQDEGVKAAASSHQNMKRTIYLEAAEALVRQISDHVNAAEYHVLGIENAWEGDFIQAKAYYELAVKRSQYSSATKQSEILGLLAAIYFSSDPALKNIQKGRASFERAVQVLDNREDAYSCYTRALTYRNWAGSERFAQNLAEADTLLKRAYEEWVKIPSATAVGWSADLRTIAYQWVYLGSAYFQSRQDMSYIEKGRSAFREAQQVIDSLNREYGVTNDYNTATQGFILHWWGQQEYLAGFQSQGQQLLGQAEQAFQRLSDNFPWKNFYLAELKKVQSQIARGEAQVSPPPRSAPSDANIQSEALPGVVPDAEKQVRRP